MITVSSNIILLTHVFIFIVLSLLFLRIDFKYYREYINGFGLYTCIKLLVLNFYLRYICKKYLEIFGWDTIPRLFEICLILLIVVWIYCITASSIFNYRRLLNEQSK